MDKCLRRLVRRLRRDRRGIAAVELALLFPVVMMLTFGVTEVSRFILLNLKLANAASALGDLVSRDTTVTTAGLADAIAAAGHIASPFDLEDAGGVVITAAGPDNGDVQVYWQHEHVGIAAKSQMDAARLLQLTQDLLLIDGETLIVVELYYDYEPWLLGFVGKTRLRKEVVYRPRLAALQQLS